MASSRFLSHFFFVLSILQVAFATRRLSELVRDSPNQLRYHNGRLLTEIITTGGQLSLPSYVGEFVEARDVLILIWYGNFKPSQKAIISDFITSLSLKSEHQPSVATWWKTTENYHNKLSKSSKPASSLTTRLGKQVFDTKYSLGKSLSDTHLAKLASKVASPSAVNIVLTANDVAVNGFCSSRCGTHRSGITKSLTANGKVNKYKFVYIWVGNSETQCPGQCAWPFHQPIYGPQGAPLVAPNNDVGLDGMVINLASLLAGTFTNPFGNGYYQGDAGAPLEAASACPGVYGKGAYPGYPGDLLVDSTTGASYNAHGTNGRKYLVPAMYDPSTSTCSTLV